MCQAEKKPIGVSFVTIKIKVDRFGRVKSKTKVNDDSWAEGNCKFAKGYEIDFSKFKDGDAIHCPKCGSLVDFIAFGSSTKPDIVDAEDTDKSNT